MTRLKRHRNRLAAPRGQTFHHTSAGATQRQVSAEPISHLCRRTNQHHSVQAGNILGESYCYL
eukprot:5052204-Prymnesium_polylepis.1